MSKARRSPRSERKATKSSFQSDKFWERSLSSLLEGRELYVFLFLVVSIVVVVFRDYLFLNRVYLFKDIGSDSITTFYPRLVHLADYLRTEGFPRWSFNFGMGENILPFGIGDVFNNILYLYGRDYLAFGIVYNEAIKIILGGIFFFLYLKMLGLTPYACTVGGILFSFSGYMVLGGSGWFVNTSTEAFWASVVLFSFEKFLKEEKWYFLPLTFAFIASFHPFYVYLSSVFLLLYALIRYVYEREVIFSRLLLFLGKVLGLITFGVAIGFIFFFSSFQQMLDSPRVAGSESTFVILSSRPVFDFAPLMEYVSILMRIFSNDLIGKGSYFKGWYNYLEAPLLYCGLVCILLAPQAVILGKGKRKTMFIVVVVLCILPLIFPYFRYMFWAFAGNYYRAFSYYIALAVLVQSLYALHTIESRRELSQKGLLASLCISLLVLYLPLDIKDRIINTDLRLMISGLLVIHTVLILLLRLDSIRLFVQLVLLLAICLEAAYLSSITVNDRDTVSSRELREPGGYNDHTNDAIAYLNERDTGFFRVTKDYGSGSAIHPSFNDAMIQRFKGTMSYSSFNQKYYIRFLQGVGIIREGHEAGTRWAVGVGARPILMSLVSVKYALTKSLQQPWSAKSFDFVKTFGDVGLFQNNFYMPLGFCYDRFMTEQEFEKLSSLQKDKLLLTAFVTSDEQRMHGGDFEALIAADTTSGYSLEQYGKDINALRSDTLVIMEHGQNNIRGTISLEKAKMLFFSIPYDKGWIAEVNGRKVDLEVVNMGFLGMYLGKGTHEIELHYSVPNLTITAGVSGFSFFVYVVLVGRVIRKRQVFNES